MTQKSEAAGAEVRLNPGTHLKPHYGNGPRLSAHLSATCAKGGACVDRLKGLRV